MSYEFQGIEKNKRLVLLLGNVDYDGITSPLKAGREQYKKKLLESNPENWASILDLFNEFNVQAVVAKFTPWVYKQLCDAQYNEVGPALLKCLASHRHHIVFVYKDLLSERSSPNPEDESESSNAYDPDHLPHFRPSAAVLSQVNNLLRQHQINLAPYETNAELTVIATQFLRDSLANLIFRIYVPSGRLWANEVDRLLELFQDFLSRTGRKGIRLEQLRTDNGISYEFHGNEFSTSISDEFQEFSRFLDLCVSDPGGAEALLRQRITSEQEVVEILARYGKEARRLQVDLRHDRERKLLNIRQRLEAELSDALRATTDWELINRLVENTMPTGINIGSAYSFDQRPLTMGLGNGSALTINVKPQIINHVRGVVAQEILGDAIVSEQNEELLECIQHYGGNRAVELTSAVHELSDTGVADPKRLSGAAKLKAFVLSIAPHLGQAGVNVLQSYIETRLHLK